VDVEVLGAAVLEAQALTVAWLSGGGLEQPFRTASVENAGCTTPTPRRHCCPCARTAISLRPWFWSVAGDVDANSAANGLFVDRPRELAACVVAEASALISDEDCHTQTTSMLEARGVNRRRRLSFEPSHC
jgi:hypothetical protein